MSEPNEATIEAVPKPQKKGPPPRVFSGMQPTGALHLGNWMGALMNWVAMVDEAKAQPADARTDLIFCIVDQHALTAEYDPRELPTRVIEAARYYVAAGIDPEYSKLFVQSHVPEHTELAWYLTTLTPMGELERMTQFKEKSQQQQSVLAGIFTYPVLMAADILLYKATVVPVGEDQVQHLELTREIARKFNNRYTPKRKYPTFPEPQQKLSIAPRIMGLDGQFKMSKSRGNDIGMLESDAEIRKKLKGAFTDPQRVTRDIPGNPDVCNIFTMHKAVSAPELVKTANDNCRSAGWGCGDCKEALGASLSEKLTPIRSKAEVLAKQPDQLWDVLSDGARKCRALAQETMREVRERMGIVPARP